MYVYVPDPWLSYYCLFVCMFDEYVVIFQNFQKFLNFLEKVVLIIIKPINNSINIIGMPNLKVTTQRL